MGAFMGINPEMITLCTTNMNRNEYLKKALPTWLGRDFKEIIIVDWNSAIPVIKDLDNFRNKGLKIIRVDDQSFFNCTKSRNLAAEYCTTPYIWLIDGDVQITSKNLNFLKLTPGTFYHGSLFTTGAPTTGSCIMEKKMFNNVNGYSEFISTLPGEDLDLYNRLKAEGYKRKYFPFGSLKHIYHPYALRTKYRPWFGMSRAAGTRATFKELPWDKHYEQCKIAHEVYCF
jgi:predicted glycosyltransferase involved in capsule biosynthesis